MTWRAISAWPSAAEVMVPVLGPAAALPAEKSGGFFGFGKK
jgi:hypothetical protein